MPVAITTIKQFSLFNQLPNSIIEQLSQHASLAEVPRRKIIMHKGQVAHSMGLLLEGRLQAIDMTLDGHEAGLYFIEPNDFFGELSVIDGQIAPEFIISLSPSRFIMIPAEIIQKLTKISSEVASIINSRLAQRLREAIAQRTLLAMPTPLQRICAQLLTMSKTEQGRIIISLPPTHQELAIMINTSRETVTRAFQKLQKNGTIKRDGPVLIIYKLNEIKQIAHGDSNN